MSENEAPSEQTRSRSRTWMLIPLVLFAALSGLFYERLIVGGNPAAVPSPLIDKPVPEFSLPALKDLTASGEAVPGFSEADLKGSVSLVNIWASWCLPCRDEHPILMDLAKRDGIRIYGINYKDKTENALRFLDGLGNPYAGVGADESGRVSIDWGVYGVPETFVVNGNGCITYKHVGPLNEDLIARKLLPAIELAQTTKIDCRAAAEGKLSGLTGAAERPGS